MKILTLHMVRDTLGFKGPMDAVTLSYTLGCPILDVALVAERGVALGLLVRVQGVYSTTWVPS